jgi:uracil phosphoribosyltransferase|tara:strand:- start:1391 stop:2011 length:621 start_codon:yes stop_codon:yes gene_type:complete
MHYEVKHPCIQDKLAEVRKIGTTHQNFRRLVTEITMLLSFKALENVSVEDVIVETPIQKANCKRICEEIVVIPILRAGMGMLDGVLSLVPSARVGFLGMFRNEETAEPESYYENIPAKSLEGLHLIIDPMLATGGSTIAAIDALKEKNIKKIIVICIVTCPEGLKTVSTKHPDIKIYTASIDSHLNDDKYIVPGLGDAGDRLYGTD